jgi:hypothetical protein
VQTNLLDKFGPDLLAELPPLETHQRDENEFKILLSVSILDLAAIQRVFWRNFSVLFFCVRYRAATARFYAEAGGGGCP